MNGWRGGPVQLQAPWLVIQFPVLPFVQNASVGTTVLVVKLLFLFNKQRCVFSESNFKLRFLGNKLHVLINTQLSFLFQFCPHAAKKDQAAEWEMVGSLFPASDVSPLWPPASSRTFLYSLFLISLSRLPVAPEGPTQPTLSQESWILVFLCKVMWPWWKSHHLTDDVTQEIWQVGLWEGDRGRKVQRNAPFNPTGEDLCLGSSGLPRGGKLSPEGVLLHTLPTQRLLSPVRNKLESCRDKAKTLCQEPCVLRAVLSVAVWP